MLQYFFNDLIVQGKPIYGQFLKDYQATNW